MTEEQPQPQIAPTPPIVVNKPKKSSSFWSFNTLYIVKQLSTILHALAQVAATGGLFYYIYDSKMYWLVLATPIVWIAVRFLFEILVVPFVISYDLEQILQKISKNEE